MYGAIALLLVILVICNNLFWRLGKNVEQDDVPQYLESDGVTYNVPYVPRIMEF